LLILSENEGNVTLLTPNTLSSKECNITARVVVIYRDENCQLLNKDLSLFYGAIFFVSDNCNDNIDLDYKAGVKTQFITFINLLNNSQAVIFPCSNYDRPVGYHYNWDYNPTTVYGMVHKNVRKGFKIISADLNMGRILPA
jgi:hypothetical protein